MKILAIDPSVNLGWAASSGESGTEHFKTKPGESEGMKLIRLRGWLLRFYCDFRFDLLVYESAVMYGNHGRSAGVPFKLEAVIQSWCEDAEVDYRGFAPSEIKMHALNKGSGPGTGKPQMVQAANLKWPSKNLTKKNEDEADALWLLDLAQKEYGG